MKTILKSILLTTLVVIFSTCVFIIIGLLLNFWNETIINCVMGFLGAVIIGGITYFAIETAVNSWKGNNQHPF